MASTINANNTTGLVSTADTSGILQLQTNGTTAVTVDDSQRVAFVAGTAALPAITTTGDTNTGIFFPAADTIAFAEGGVEAMRLDASGNLGLGVTPSAYGTNFKAIQIGLAGNVASQTGARTIEITSNAYNNSGWKYQATDKATLYYQYDGGHAWSTAASGTAGNAITFTQAMTLDSSGNLLVGTTTSSGKITSSSASTAALSAIISSTSQLTTVGLNIQKADNNSTTSNWFQAFTINAGAIGSGLITANGASAAAFGAFSDSRLKENIVNLPSQLDNIMALRPVEFDYIESMGGGHQIGFIAQEVQAVFPDLVSADPNGMLTLTDMNKNDARLIKAIQEQQAIIESLTQRITALEGQ